MRGALRSRPPGTRAEPALEEAGTRDRLEIA